jgi:hypothetical protein
MSAKKDRRMRLTRRAKRVRDDAEYAAALPADEEAQLCKLMGDAELDAAQADMRKMLDDISKGCL